jgi:hypothetical protein
MFFRLLLFCPLFLSACAALPASPQPATAVTTKVSAPDLIATVSTPHIDQPPDGQLTTSPPDPQNCGYQWAYQDLPDLSSHFRQSIQTLQPEAEASAFAFGENCILSDGSIGRFLPMETDFNVTLQVNDLTDEAELGEWIVDVMGVITQIPPEQIVGPRPGRVSLIFTAGGEQTGVNFYIDQFQKLPAGLSSAEIFRTLRNPQ